MKRRQNKTGVTLVEILVVVAIIAILVTIVIGVAARIDTQGKEQLTKNTFALLTAALGGFRDYGYSYSAPSDANFKFPLDCNGFSDTDLKTELQTALGTTVSIGPPGTHDADYSGCEAMYFFLNRVPESRETLDRIDKKLVTNLDIGGSPMEIAVGSGADKKLYPLFRVIDPWGKTLRYDYYDEKPPPHSPSDIEDMEKSRKTFPLIISAGPDGDFNTVGDNITNRE
jgi:prepilin-type N-terminal cleavage/methylation domain-containing protein